MITTKRKETWDDIPVKVTCNKSGKFVDLEKEAYPFESNLMHSFQVHFGYGSDFDMDTWEFELHEDELLNFVKTFRHKPKGFCNEARYPNDVWNEWIETGRINWKAGWSEGEIAEEKELEEQRKQRIENHKKILGLKK